MQAVVILAAGQGARMRSKTPKVLHELAGVPMLLRVLNTARTIAPDRIYIVVASEQKQQIAQYLTGEDFELVGQAEINGTGYALQVALAAMPEDTDADVLVLYGDMPLLHARTLKALCRSGQQNDLTLLTARLDNPAGYGRLLYDDQDQVVAIVEDACLTEAQAGIKEVNLGACAAKKSNFAHWLSQIQTGCLSKEAYLTDIVHIARKAGCQITALQPEDQTEAIGVNDKADLARAEAEQQRRLSQALLAGGTTLASPEHLTIRGEVQLGQDCYVDVGAVLIGPLQIGDNVQIGAYSVLSESRVASNVSILPFSHISCCKIGSGARIGPYARLRDGTEVFEGAEVGNFVEAKASQIGAQSRAKHLTYLGDTQIGQDSNIGAGTVTCNYDGERKHRTRIGDGVFVGSNSTLIAPLHLDDQAYITAGATVSRDVGKDEMATTRARQRNLRGSLLRRTKKKP